MSVNRSQFSPVAARSPGFSAASEVDRVGSFPRGTPPPVTGGPAVLVRARAVRTNVIRATFAVPVVAYSRAGLHDATNPRLWSIVRLPNGYTPPIVAIVPVDGDPTSVDLWVAGSLDAVAYQVTATGIRNV